MSRVLFIAKKADYNYSGGDPLRVTGLKLSAGMCVAVLIAAGIPAKLAIVNDNNDIDREVRIFQPTHVVIEALWVVPSKFAVLTRLYPDVQWIIRVHSEIPFLSMEGISIEWLLDYVKYDNVYVSGNSPNLNAAIKDILKSAYPDQLVNAKNIYLPNCYVAEIIPPRTPMWSARLHIGCFGAIRPFKNQLIQAIAAMTYAESVGKSLVFHMNGTRQETGGSAVLKNIVALFDDSPNHLLRLHPWMNHSDFLHLCAKMDLGMQVSLSESFNIVTADMVTVGVPTVVSPAIYWMPKGFMADPTNLASIVDRLGYAQSSEHWWFGRDSAQRALRKQAALAAKIWTTYFR
jgi:hypothetical protein